MGSRDVIVIDFMGIGAQKAGTTWLYENLNRHPGIHFPAGKEVHYWNARVTAESLDWYRNLFEGFPDTRNGEITPAYSILPEDKVNQIKSAFPDLKIILILRNPIDRAWSSALMALRRSEMLFHEASHQWFIDHVQSCGSLARGDYLRIVQLWERSFGSQMLILRYEDIETGPREFFDRASRHIGVGELEGPIWDLSERVFGNEHRPMPKPVKDKLFSIYSPKISQLERYLGWDLSGWLENEI